jgi:hypothetical protein
MVSSPLRTVCRDLLPQRSQRSRSPHWKTTIKTVPTLFYTTNPKDPKSLSDGFPVFYISDNQAVPAQTDPAEPIFRNVHMIGISRASMDAGSSEVRVYYPALNRFGRETCKIVYCRIRDDNPQGGPECISSADIEGRNAKNDSAILGAFTRDEARQNH